MVGANQIISCEIWFILLFKSRFFLFLHSNKYKVIMKLMIFNCFGNVFAKHIQLKHNYSFNSAVLFKCVGTVAYNNSTKIVGYYCISSTARLQINLKLNALTHIVWSLTSQVYLNHAVSSMCETLDYTWLLYFLFSAWLICFISSV